MNVLGTLFFECMMDRFPVVWNATKRVSGCLQVFRRIVPPSWVRVQGLRNLPCRILSNLTLRRLMSYIYGAPILDVSRSHTTTQHSR